ncbi:tRNA pseudouridine(38-40) synthase TruA [Pedobacter sp. P351]|uniref:tRNA pseudouridine(38-40) synthase TruA n=1 Tax=Pedobacter superstes TaxID=3133441 RepID=UPI0030AA031F
MRYFFHIGYNGANYCGWQKHASVVTVQQVIETALSQIVKFPVKINGCGRTDAGVHASQFFFHTDFKEEWNFDLKFRLNKILPPDIAVFDIVTMEGLPHARFDAIQRQYDYLIHTYKDPFLNGFSSLYLDKHLDMDKMNLAARILPLYSDYAAFCKSPAKNEHTICHVSSATFYANSSGDRFRFQISSNRFLGRMIRILMGKLLKIGSGNLSVDEFENYLITKRTPLRLEPAHPQGLYLSKVTYPYLDLKPKPDFLIKW